MKTHAFADSVHLPRGKDDVAYTHRERKQHRVLGDDSRITRLVFGLVFFGFLVARDVTRREANRSPTLIRATETASELPTYKPESLP